MLVGSNDSRKMLVHFRSFSDNLTFVRLVFLMSGNALNQLLFTKNIFGHRGTFSFFEKRPNLGFVDLV